ncbi:MAG: hypothetical protein EON54_22425, partial [Alcaligenaceae bacterium]
MFAIPATGNLIVAAEGYLWKLSRYGEVLDTFRTPERMYTSGVAFTPYYYNDWVYSGDRHNKAYSPATNGNFLSPVQLRDELDSAEHVEFGRNDTNAWAYIIKNGKGSRLDVTNLRDEVDTYCTSQTFSEKQLKWRATCLRGYRPRHKSWIEIEPEIFPPNHDAHATVVNFTSRKFQLERGLFWHIAGLPLGLIRKSLGVAGNFPEHYWIGDASVVVAVNKELLRFKTFVAQKNGEVRFENLAWWNPSRALPGANSWLTVATRDRAERKGEKVISKEYEDEIGLYAIGQNAGNDGIGQKPYFGWRGRFLGPETGAFAVSAKVHLMDTNSDERGRASHTWLRAPIADKPAAGVAVAIPAGAPWPTLRNLPSAITMHLSTDAVREDMELRVDFNADELVAAFSKLHDLNAPLEIVVQVPTLQGPLSYMSVALRHPSNGNLTALNRSQFT